MMNKPFCPEVLAPAGDAERLETAIRYGADAVYLGAKTMGMRAGAQNFDFVELQKAVYLAHSKGVKVYLTCNTLPTNSEVEQLYHFFEGAKQAGVDALIVADIGVLLAAKRTLPEMEIHISTQTGIVNYLTATELYRMGATRVVLARELSLEDIRTIRDKTPPALEIECFVHGAMCVSFSGRCLLSQYFVGRDANRGECAQPCRWGYHIVEEKRPGQYFPIYEEDGSTFILNAKDMCMIEHIGALVDAGISSLKIEGRAKSFYYVGVVTNAYRAAVDGYLQDPKGFVLPAWVEQETRKVSHRQYTTGFYFGKPEDGQYTQNGGYVRAWDVVGVVDSYQDGKLFCTQRNKFSIGDTLEILAPKSQPIVVKVEELFDSEGASIQSANRAMMQFALPAQQSFAQGSILRKEVVEKEKV